jgi:hypothetical protein
MGFHHNAVWPQQHWSAPIIRTVTSAAGRKFEGNCRDIDRLLQIHQTEGGTDRGRRVRLEVLNKSAIVLLTAFWEAYCEDVAGEALEYIVRHTKDAGGLPQDLRKAVAKELKEEPHELAVWRLADTGWRTELASRLTALKEKRDRQLNTPKTQQIDDLFKQALGISDLPKSWRWQRMSARRAGGKLDEFVELRGSIAHRGHGAAGVLKSQVEEYYDHVKHLVEKTDARVRDAIQATTGRVPW